ncbi:MAG: hypothetical protein JNN30_13190 [Rhodanobacteraceae bacterium]|nr:hypothetical protein [Rhodanobacteraceae bacterium]
MRNAILSLLLACAGGATASVVPQAALSDLDWRLVGPFRAGWSTVAAGVAEQPQVYYFGAAGGGVWKTTDGGHNWVSVFDRQSASVGALAVAPSDPRVIYVDLCRQRTAAGTLRRRPR